MDSNKATDIKKSIRELIEQVKHEISGCKDSLDESGNKNLIDSIKRLESIVGQLAAKTSSGNYVTELLNIQAGLEKSKGNFVSQPDNTGIRIWSIDTDMKIVALNSNFKEDFKTVFNVELKAGSWVFEGVHDPIKDVWLKRYNRAFAGEQLVIVEELQNGRTPRFVEVSLVPVHVGEKAVGVSCYSCDITARKQTEAVLRENEDKYRAIFNSMSDIFISTDLDGNIVIVSPSIMDLLGYVPEEIIGKPITKLYKDPDDRKILISNLVEKGFVHDHEAILLSRDKKEITASINARLLIDNNGKPSGTEGVARNITSRKMAEKAVDKRTKKLDYLFENAPIMLLLVDSKGKIHDINKTCSQYSYKNKSQLLNLLAGEVLNCFVLLKKYDYCGEANICKDCVIRNAIINTFETRQDQGQIEGSLTIVKNNREIERQFLVSTTYIDSEENKRVLLSLDDITDIRAAENEIRRLSAVVEQSNAAILITDIEGKIEYVNPKFEKTTGYKSDEVLGKNPSFLKSTKIPPEEYKDMWATILAGNNWQGEFLNVRKDNSEYWENAVISPIADSTGKITSFVAINEDITERKRIQQELVDSEKELREMNDEKTRYFSILAHDLRGLVGGFYAYSDLIQAHFDDFPQKELKAQIQNLTKASGDALNLLDNLLVWGKTTQGRLTLELRKFDAHKEITSIINLFNKFAVQKKIELVNSSSENTFIKTDSNVFSTILRNLLSNAIKFTPESGTITIHAKNVTGNEKYIEVSVTDTGIGMDKKYIKRLFKLGEKIAKKGTNNEQGTGLGLIICKEMVKRLGGTINVESEPGKGSRFYFKVPQ